MVTPRLFMRSKTLSSLLRFQFLSCFSSGDCSDAVSLGFFVKALSSSVNSSAKLSAPWRRAACAGTGAKETYISVAGIFCEAVEQDRLARGQTLSPARSGHCVFRREQLLCLLIHAGSGVIAQLAYRARSTFRNAAWSKRSGCSIEARRFCRSSAARSTIRARSPRNECILLFVSMICMVSLPVATRTRRSPLSA